MSKIPATSFICERSAELLLVSELKNIVNTKYSNPIVLYPWLSREFSKISMEIHKFDYFRVLVIFSRRPKLANNSTDIFLTVNSRLETFNEIATKHNVPVIIGCPLARNFWELSDEAKIVWISMSNIGSEPYLHCLTDHSLDNSFLDSNEIIELIDQSKEFSIEAFELFVREGLATLPFRFYGAGYKPIYLLVKAD